MNNSSQYNDNINEEQSGHAHHSSDALLETSTLVGSKDMESQVADSQNACVEEQEQRLNCQIEDNYQVSWMPAMMMTNESALSYMVEGHSNKISPDLIDANAYVQLPTSYNISSNKEMYGYMMGNNPMMPIDSYPMVNYSNYGKMCSSTNLTNSDQNEIRETMQNISKGAQEPDNAAIDIHRDMSCGLPNDSIGATHPTYCVYCHKYYKTVEELQSHVMIEHPEHSQMSSFLDNSGMQHQFPTCPTCQIGLVKINNYNTDFPLEDPNDDEQHLNLMQGNSILMMCERCSKEYTLSLTTEHAQPPVHQEPPKRHFCQHCQRSYKHNRDLLKHLRSAHGLDTTMERTQPTNAYPSSMQSGQVIPSSDVHSHPAKLSCHICKKMFRGPFELKRHNHTVHENKRPYKCKECNKSFRDAYELKRHSASHARMRHHNITTMSGIHNPMGMDMMSMPNLDPANISTESNPSDVISQHILPSMYNMPNTGTNYHPSMGHVDYYCHSCDKNFRGANEFKRHYSVVHEKKYRYKCIHCGKLWRDQYDLKRHCLRSHKMDKDIDRSFIRQCLLENNVENSAVVIQPQISIPPYDLGDQSGTITLNQETAEAIFGSNDVEMRGHSSSITDQYCISRGDNMNNDSQVNLFANLSSIPNASMLYHSANSPQLVNNIIQSHDDENIVDESKHASTWTTFENDLQGTPPSYLRSPK